MKVLKWCSIILLCTSINFSAFSQDILNSIPVSLKSNNIKELAKSFDNRLDITINDEANNYSSEQANIILKNFLNKVVIKDFTVLHKGTSNTEANFIIGNLSTNQGIYRTYFYIKKINGNNFIQEIRFEKE